jgi:biotin synthase
MGETRIDRIMLLLELANLNPQPQSVPINSLVKIKGTPLGESEKLDNFEFIRTIAIARILMPKTAVRLSAGRLEMSEEMQAMCFFAGANSCFYGEKLLTTENPEMESDIQFFKKIGINQ